METVGGVRGLQKRDPFTILSENMANYTSKTVSNSPAVSNPDALEDVLDKWAFRSVDPMGGTIEAKVTDQDNLVIIGDANFTPVHTDHVDPNAERISAEPPSNVGGFLKAVAPFLEESLIVQTISSRELRYLFRGTQYIVTPDGRTDIKRFRDHQQSFLPFDVNSDTDSAESADEPMNFTHITESFELAMESHSEIPDDAIDDIVGTVEEACAAHKQMLAWQHDYDELIGQLDPLLDHLSNNGYTKEVSHIDTVRERLENSKVRLDNYM